MRLRRSRCAACVAPSTPTGRDTMAADPAQTPMLMLTLGVVALTPTPMLTPTRTAAAARPVAGAAAAHTERLNPSDPDSFVGWQARSRAAAPSPPVLPSGSTARAMATTTSIPRWITKPAQSSPLLPASNAINQSPMMSLVCLGNDKGKSD